MSLERTPLPWDLAGPDYIIKLYERLPYIINKHWIHPQDVKVGDMQQFFIWPFRILPNSILKYFLSENNVEGLKY